MNIRDNKLITHVHILGKTLPLGWKRSVP